MCKYYRHGKDNLLQLAKDEGKGGPVWLADNDLAVEITDPDKDTERALDAMLSAYDEDSDEEIVLIVERDVDNLPSPDNQKRLH